MRNCSAIVIQGRSDIFFRHTFVSQAGQLSIESCTSATQWEAEHSLSRSIVLILFLLQLSVHTQADTLLDNGCSMTIECQSDHWPASSSSSNEQSSRPPLIWPLRFSISSMNERGIISKGEKERERSKLQLVLLLLLQS